MKAARRHELQQNALADWLAVKLVALRPYATALGIAVLVVLVAWAGWTWWGQSSRAKVAESWDRYLRVDTNRDVDRRKALQDVASSYPNSTAAIFAQLQLAVDQLTQANDLLLREREEGNNLIDQAVKNFQNVLDTSNDPQVRQYATFHLGRAYEARVQLENAKEQYDRLVKTWPGSAYATAAQARLDDLAKPQTQEFYTWFRTARAEIATTSPGSSPPKGPPPIPVSPDAQPLPEDDLTLPPLKPESPPEKADPAKSAKPAEGPPLTAPSKESPPKAGDAKTNEAKSGDAKAADAKAGDAKASGTQVDGGKTGDGKPAGKS